VGITIDDMRKAEESGKVSDSPKRVGWKVLVSELLERENRFLSASEIRDALKASSHVYTQLSYLKKSGLLNMKVLDGKSYYGLKKWSEQKKNTTDT